MSKIKINNSNTIAQNRHLGLDCLRLLAMFFVVLLHVLGHGGILTKAQWMSHQYMTAWFLETVAYCAVNTFALLSGYVGVQSDYTFKLSLSRVFHFWLYVMFYSVTITVVFLFFNPEMVLSLMSTPKECALFVIKTVFPFLSSRYWYAKAYMVVCLFMPLMNAAIGRLKKKQFEFYMVLGFIFFSFLPCILQYKNAFFLHNGCSGHWLCILYLCGGYMRRYNIAAKITRRRAVFIFTISTMLTWGSKILLENLPLGGLSNIIPSDVFISSYLSPLVIVNAVALLCFFANCEFKSNIARRLITTFAPAAFGVYLIHENILIRDNFIKGCSAHLVSRDTLTMTLNVFGYATTIFVTCLLIDFARIWLLRRIRQRLSGNVKNVL